MINSEVIINILGDISYKPLKISELSYLLGISKDKKAQFKNIVNTLINNGDVFISKNHKLVLPHKLGFYKGVFFATTKGFGFVKVQGIEKDIFIPKTSKNGAFHKDIVFISIKDNEGTVVKIISRGITELIGTVCITNGDTMVIPQKNLAIEVFIKKGTLKNIVHGHKVVVKLLHYKTNSQGNPKGEIVEVIGHENDPFVDIMSIIKEAKVPTQFSKKAIEEAESSVNISYGSRLDLRHMQIVTIDGEDAKDLDDGISLSYENDIYTLGVHIADVSHYVKEDTTLDKEALARGTSIYLLDRVIPMLPHILSNGICSLTQGEDRLALSLIMQINEKGQVISHNIQETIINVNKRMTYTNVAKILQAEDTLLMGTSNENIGHLHGYAPYIPLLYLMKDLSLILNKRRVLRGALDLGLSESKVLLDNKGKPTEIILREKNIATKIIEEFMIIANETVAQHHFWLSTPFIYRVHSKPNSEKLEELNSFIAGFGYNLKGSKIHPKSIQSLLNKIKGTKEESIINSVILRSLKHARYTPNNDGHFGLASEYYCHFTSPIRRYPDLFIHRIIKSNINNRQLNKFISIQNSVADITSVSECRAEELEREVLNYKKAEFMKDKIGHEFNGIISSVTPWGIYVQLPNTVEGMVKISDIKGDIYTYDRPRHRYISSHTNNVFSLGDIVNVKLVQVQDSKIDFVFL